MVKGQKDLLRTVQLFETKVASVGMGRILGQKEAFRLLVTYMNTRLFYIPIFHQLENVSDILDNRFCFQLAI